MRIPLTIQLEVEKLDCQGNTIGMPEVCVEAEYISDKGSRDHYGVPMEPDYDSMTIESVTLEDGEDYELTREEEERAMEALWEALKGAGPSDDF